MAFDGQKGETVFDGQHALGVGPVMAAAAPRDAAHTLTTGQTGQTRTPSAGGGRVALFSEVHERGGGGWGDEAWVHSDSGQHLEAPVKRTASGNGQIVNGQTASGSWGDGGFRRSASKANGTQRRVVSNGVNPKP